MLILPLEHFVTCLSSPRGTKTRSVSLINQPTKISNNFSNDVDDDDDGDDDGDDGDDDDDDDDDDGDDDDDDDDDGGGDSGGGGGLLLYFVFLSKDFRIDCRTNIE